MAMSATLWSLGLWLCWLCEIGATTLKVDYSAWGDANYTTVEVMRHAPCNVAGAVRRSRGAKRFLLQFEAGGSWAGKAVALDPTDPGCYVIRGNLHINSQRRKGSGKQRMISPSQIKAYTEIRIGSPTSAPEPCRKSAEEEDSICGGVGSCFYCQRCSKLRQSVKLSIRHQNGEEMDCKTKIGPGDYPMEAKFCPPSEQQLRSAYAVTGIDMKDMLDLGGKKVHILLLLFASANSRRKWAAQKKRLEKEMAEKYPYHPLWEPYPPKLLAQMPFEKQKFNMAIACHKIFGRFVVNRSNSRR